ncbi:MAG TPA: chemotaxis protein CheX [Phycisphaerae bacterium]|nr:chemotaxis protein CheX [Phycisphaerae bacterium]
MDVRFVRPFVAAIHTVFKTMLNTEVQIGTPHATIESGNRADVSSVIGFSGQATGCVVLSFPSEVACKVASAFASIPLDEKHPDFSDAIGELANMVAGNAKKDFSGMQVNISLPNVIVGKDHIVTRSRMFPRVVFPCSCDLGDFEIKVAVKAEQVGSSAAGAMAAASAG